MLQKSDFFLGGVLAIIIFLFPMVIAGASADNQVATAYASSAKVYYEPNKSRNKKSLYFKDIQDMHITESGLDFIKEFEGFYSNVYNDEAGHATIGYGYLIHYGNYTQEDVNNWGTLSEQDATEFLRKDIVNYEDYVKKYITVPLTQNQFDSLVSFVYNVGEGGIHGSTLGRELNNGNYHNAANCFLAWKYAGGVIYEGLERRRKLERRLFLRGINKK